MIYEASGFHTLLEWIGIEAIQSSNSSILCVCVCVPSTQEKSIQRSPGQAKKSLCVLLPLGR